METAIGAGEFRTLMAGFPTGVGIVTAFDSVGQPWGMTCSSICSVSVDPPVLLVCLRLGSPTLDAMMRQSSFAVNLLHERGRRAAELFASGDPNRFERIRWHAARGSGGPHLRDDAHSVADCTITQHQQVGDHMVVYGEVQQIVHHTASAATPLLYGRRQYASWPA